MKPTIRLYEVVGTGVILTCASGVMVSNQTGGASCLQPEVEGVYIPLRNDYGLNPNAAIEEGRFARRSRCDGSL